ncbi:hypothetical protein ACVWXN_010437 [Bradyrhizobium sp. i1.4.4]
MLYTSTPTVSSRYPRLLPIQPDTALPGTPLQKTDGVVLVCAVLTWSFSVRFQ